MKNNTTAETVDIPTDNEIRIAAYPIQLSKIPEQDGGGFQAVYPPLARSVVGYGATEIAALVDLKAVTALFQEALTDTGQTLPEVIPQTESCGFSGKFNVRVPKVLHQELVKLADDQGVSLNSLVQLLLTSGVAALASDKLFKAELAPLENTSAEYTWDRSSLPIRNAANTRFVTQPSTLEWP